MLAAARIAEDLVSGCTPSGEAAFTLAASVIGAARAADPRAGQLAFELAANLLENVPHGHVWAETRGRLSATKLFAWLLLQAVPDLAESGKQPANGQSVVAGEHTA